MMSNKSECRQAVKGGTSQHTHLNNEQRTSLCSFIHYILAILSRITVILHEERITLEYFCSQFLEHTICDDSSLGATTP